MPACRVKSKLYMQTQIHGTIQPLLKIFCIYTTVGSVAMLADTSIQTYGKFWGCNCTHFVGQLAVPETRLFFAKRFIPLFELHLSACTVLYSQSKAVDCDLRRLALSMTAFFANLARCIFAWSCHYVVTSCHQNRHTCTQELHSLQSKFDCRDAIARE